MLSISLVESLDISHHNVLWLNPIDNCQTNSDCIEDEKCVDYICQPPSNINNKKSNGRQLVEASKLAKLFFWIYFWQNYAMHIPHRAQHMYDMWYILVVQFREKRKKFFAEGGRVSELKALLVSERVFCLEDQRSAQAYCSFSSFLYFVIGFVIFLWNTNSRHPRLAATGTLQNTQKKRLTTCSSCQTVTSS